MASSRLCSIPGCGKRRVGRGWCSLHWQRWQKHGDPLWEPVRQPPICSVDKCQSPTKAKGLCQAHYWRLRKHGSFEGGRTAPGEPLRFLQEVVLPYRGDDCLHWPFASNGVGYGMVWLNGRFHVVSRVVCEEIHGTPPTAAHEAAHSCGKGHELCCAPNHLHWATTSENHQEKAEHGTDNRGEKHPLVKLSEDDVRNIRALKGKMLQKEIAALYGIGRVQVSRIHNGQRWQYLI